MSVCFHVWIIFIKTSRYVVPWWSWQKIKSPFSLFDVDKRTDFVQRLKIRHEAICLNALQVYCSLCKDLSCLHMKNLTYSLLKDVWRLALNQHYMQIKNYLTFQLTKRRIFISGVTVCFHIKKTCFNFKGTSRYNRVIPISNTESYTVYH
jgi:hypothetical protein